MLTGVLVFLLFLIALLAIPVTLTFKLSWPKDCQQDALLKWAFGLVKVRIPASEPKALSSAGNESKRKTHRSGDSFGRRANILAPLRSKPFRQRIVRFVGDLWLAIHKKDVSLRVRVGLGDPADTGQLWAIVGPIAGLLATVQGAAIAIEPEFLDSTFELNSAGSIRLVPLQLIYMIIALLLSPPVWRGVVMMRKGAGWMATCRINEMFIDPALTLIVVEAAEFRTTSTTSGGFMFGYIAPIAVVVCRQDGITALDMQAQPASVKQLRRDIPELDAVLSA